MRRRPLALVLTAALIGAVFTALPARAETAVPAIVNIEDPAGDANTTNGDNVTAAGSISNVGDLLKVWFTSEAGKISAHFLTVVPPPASAYGMHFQVVGSPNADGANCLVIRGIVPGSAPGGGAYQGTPVAKILDTCNDGSNFFNNGQEGEITVETLADGTGITTMTFDRAYSTLLADGQVFSSPVARTDFTAGEGSTGFQTLRADDTKVGTDYSIGGDGAEPPVVDEPDAPKPPKNPCKGLKGKKKKKCIKKNAAKPCATYTPGEAGTDAETSVVTDAATAEAPVEVPLTMDPSAGLTSGDIPVVGANPLISHAIQNIQVDPAAATTGLYVRVEFPEGEDYDIYLHDAEGNDSAHAGGGNQAPDALGDGTGNGGHSEGTAEQLDGVLTADCGGYTLDVANALGFGEVTLKLWLGAPTWDPAAQAPTEGSSKAFVF